MCLTAVMVCVYFTTFYHIFSKAGKSEEFCGLLTLDHLL